MKTAIRLCVAAMVLSLLTSTALMAGDWTPIYKGVEYQVATKTSPRPMKAYAIRVDLRNPAVSFLATPSNGGSPYETNLQTTPAFRSAYGLEAAINANFFTWYTPYADNRGALVSNGTLVSSHEAAFPAQLRIDSNKVAQIVAASGNPSGMHTVVSGDAYHLVGGVCLGANDIARARTSVGLSADRRYLIMCVVDEGQPDSKGATILDMSYWMKDLGAWDAMNLDGGGSSCICTASGGVLNHPSEGSPRAVGSNFGVNSAPLYRNTVCDFDGNRTTERVVWRPSNYTWYVNGQNSYAWGLPGDICLDGDMNGDGKNDYVIWRPSNYNWYVRLRDGSGFPTVTYGTAGDIPVKFDYNGDDKEDYAVFRPSEGKWYCLVNGGTTTPHVKYGEPGDIPVPADYNGDNKTDYAVVRPSTYTWYIQYNGGGYAEHVQWGQAGDIPVPGDYDGNGTADYAIWRPSDGRWRVRLTGGYGDLNFQWGANGDIPAPGDYDGDGKWDFAVWRPSNRTWYVHINGGNQLPNVVWGEPGDKIVALPYCIQKFFFQW